MMDPPMALPAEATPSRLDSVMASRRFPALGENPNRRAVRRAFRKSPAPVGRDQRPKVPV